MIDTRVQRVVNMMPDLKHYSFRLLMYIIVHDPYEQGIELKQWYIMQKTGLCQRSLQWAIKELEDKGILEREGYRGATFTVHL